MKTQPMHRKIPLGIWAVFFTQFVSYLFINARNIAQPRMIAELDGMALFSWLIALQALAGSITTLLFGKLSDLYGRRIILLASMIIFGIGLALTTQVTTMPMLIASTTFMSIGHWPMVPLCFSAVGDLFPARDRAKWTGLLNLPTGIASMIGPVLGGVIAESVFGWRGLYWGVIPLLLVAGGFMAAALTKNVQTKKPKIDIWGTFVMAIATTTLILGFSWLGTPGKLGMGIIFLLISTASWIGFIQIEKRVEAPILDPEVLFSRTFVTIAASGFLFFFASLGISVYSPIFVQEIMGISPSQNGSMLTPFSILISFMGIPAGFLLAKTGKYKWIYIISYVIIFIALLAMWRFTADTPIWLFVLVTSVAGFGMGTIPTINTLVAQFVVPKRLLGVAIGALYFFQMVGISVAPAILGFVQNSAPDIISGFKLIFLIGAIAMVLALLLIFSIPEISVDQETS